MKDLTILAAAFGLVLSIGPALAQDGPPVLDVEGTCNSPGRTSAGPSGRATAEGCLRSERTAYDQLKKRWGEFTPDAKSQCSKQSDAGGFPSYVETLTCLELATGPVPNQPGGGGMQGAKDAGGKLTDEPSPKQRTNPIDVLEKQ